MSDLQDNRKSLAAIKAAPEGRSGVMRTICYVERLQAFVVNLCMRYKKV